MANLSKSKVGSGRMKTFYAILIPVLILFIAFNTFPLLTGFSTALPTQRALVHTK